MRKVAQLAAVALGLLALVHGAALAQDASSGSPKAVNNSAKTPRRPALTDADAIWAQGRAKEAQAQAVCLTRAAKKLEAAAVALDMASVDQRQARDDEMILAMVGVDTCVIHLRPEVAVTGIHVDGACREGDPICDEDFKFAEEVTEKSRNLRGEMSRCYERGLARLPEMTGDISYRATLGKPPNVSVGTLKVLADTLGDLRVRECLQKSIQGLAFADRRAGTSFELTVKLQDAP